MENKSNIKVVCYGEILWDIFPWGANAGGAPFNVAYHLKKMGLSVNMISKIGKDDLGAELISHIKGWGIPTHFIQVDAERDTGTVIAKFDEMGEAVYDIVQPVAWDYIALDKDMIKLVREADAFVFGSLITRNRVSKQTLFELMEASKYNVFDINLRPPHFSYDVIRQMLFKTDLVKMNKAELRALLDFLGRSYVDEDDAMNYVQEQFDISEIILSKGSKGAVYHHGSDYYRFPAVPIQVGDTVGSGDSFLAGFLSKRLLGWSPIDIMNQAVALGAFVTSRHGACPEYSYDEFRKFRDASAFAAPDIITNVNPL